MFSAFLDNEKSGPNHEKLFLNRPRSGLFRSIFIGRLGFFQPVGMDDTTYRRSQFLFFRENQPIIFIILKFCFTCFDNNLIKSLAAEIKLDDTTDTHGEMKSIQMKYSLRDFHYVNEISNKFK